jgi:hypothetical protein
MFFPVSLASESEDLLLEKESKEELVLFDKKSKESSDKSNNFKK